MALGEFEIYIHQEVSIVTIDGFLQRKDSIAGAFKDNKTDFLNEDGGTGISNLDRIYSKYTEQEQTDNPKTVNIELLKVNTELIIPKSVLNKEVLSFTGKNQFLKQGTFNAFYGQSLLQLLKDPLYKPSSKFRYDINNTLTTIHPFASVWIYVGSLNSILNVTPYLMNLSTSVTKQGGSFKFNLPPVVNIEDDDLYKFNDEFYSNNNISKKNTTTILNNNEVGTLGDNNEFYFHRVIQANDIVFIKFEKLDIEREERLEDFVLNKSVLAKQFYDMIGLVDENVRSTSFGNNDVTINITGRDFMKLLIDDGSYFFPLLFIENSEETFLNVQDDNKLLKRTFSTGNYDFLYAYSFRGITSTMQFIINQLANLGVVDQNIDLFSSYGERRTTVYRLENEGDQELSTELHEGVWQIVKLLADENVADRRVADPSISQPNGSLINQFNKLAQEPYVEFFGDTYGDFYNLIVRQPPYTKSQILSVINGTVTDENIIKAQNEGLVISSDVLEKNTIDLMLSINPDDVISETLQWENEQIYSWYELRPQGAFIGQQSSISLAYIPIVYFPQYANKWGCRRLSTVTNYISYEAFTGEDSEINRDLFKEAIINDYKYLLDSHVYLPFTRKGTITINGDRRIKRGTWIRNVGTGEIFYVDAVLNDFSISRSSIDRTTTLTVSRGMVEEYTHGNITYFDIVDTETIRNILIEQLTTGDKKQSKPKVSVKSNFGVNQEIFDFFYQRQQFQ
jgi:hypothetical protein